MSIEQGPYEAMMAKLFDHDRADLVRRLARPTAQEEWEDWSNLDEEDKAMSGIYEIQQGTGTLRQREPQLVAIRDRIAQGVKAAEDLALRANALANALLGPAKEIPVPVPASEDAPTSGEFEGMLVQLAKLARRLDGLRSAIARLERACEMEASQSERF